MRRDMCPPGFVKGAIRKNDHQLAKKYGVTPITIRNWKKRLGLPLAPVSRVDYTQVEAMLREQAKPADISKATGVSESAIKRRRREMFGSTCRTVPHAKKIRNVEDIPEILRPQDRFKIACETKAAFLGLDMEAFMSGWLKGAAGQSWQHDMGF